MRPLASLLAAALVLFTTAVVSGQNNEQFRARLSPVPIDITMQNVIAGRGSVTATLAGGRVVLSGTYADLKSPATVANVHVARRGMRGPVLFALKVSGGTTGTISGELEATAAQQEQLRASGWYVQLHSEKAPEGNLWGWLLPEEVKK